MFKNRTYRMQHKKQGLVSFEVTARETNLHLQALSNLEKSALRHVLACRNQIENYISHHPKFADALEPVLQDDMAPALIREMIAASAAAGVGPMAAVAGAVAAFTGTALLKESPEIIVENGGDIFVKSNTPMTFGIHAENAPIFQTTGIQIQKRTKPYGICTSAGTLGHSLSFGKADAATVLADTCPLADAVATAMGNRVKTIADIQTAMDWAKQIPGVQGLVVAKNNQVGLWGDLKLIQLTS